MAYSPTMLRKLLILLLLLGALGAGAYFGAPSAGRWYVEQKLVPKVEQRLGCRLKIQQVRLGWEYVRLDGISLACPGDAADEPMATVAAVGARLRPLELIKGKARIEGARVSGLKLRLRRGKEGKGNVDHLLGKLRGGDGGGAGNGGGGRLQLGPVELESGDLSLVDEASQVSLSAAELSGLLRRGGASRVDLKQVILSAARLPHDVTAKGVRVAHEGEAGKWPTARVTGGHLRILPRLELSAIRGTLKPAPAAEGEARRIDIALSGSYGGAEAQLWSASGWLDPKALAGKLDLTARRFNLDRIAGLLKRSPLIHPKKVTLDGKLALSLANGVLTFGGAMEVKGVDLFHPGLARTVIPDLAGAVRAKGKLDIKKVRLDLEELAVTSGGVEATLSGVVEQKEGKPVLDLRLQVPPLPCQTVLAALPQALVPELKGFSLRGKFSTDLRSSIDFRNLDKLTLGGKVAIRRCKVKEAPEWVDAERLLKPFEHEVETEPGVNLTLLIAPASPDFVPYSEISPMVTKALLTTEDGAFFRHRGFITSQFRTALSRNLQRGGFRLGASTISMQMVKNVLLSHDKTLSRKLQELFIVWYLEQNLSKERILEIYLNVIEFGPAIYGINAAARHYFGKPAAAISPLEAAFFATLLPSPKSRYVQYCKGKLTAKWDKYTRRILRRMHSKGHISDDEYALAQAEQIIFMRDFDQVSAEDCEQRVKTLLESWSEAKKDRLEAVVRAAAPHQLEMYAPKHK